MYGSRLQCIDDTIALERLGRSGHVDNGEDRSLLPLGVLAAVAAFAAELQWLPGAGIAELTWRGYPTGVCLGKRMPNTVDLLHNLRLDSCRLVIDTAPSLAK